MQMVQMRSRMKPDRPILLCIWNYYRADITEFLLKLDDHFELVFLNDYEPSDKKGCIKECKRIFWSEYTSPYQILDELKVSQILFSDVESFHQTALVIAARNRKIKSFVLEHGLRGDFEIDLQIQLYYQRKNKKLLSENTNEVDNSLLQHQSFKTLKFYLSSIRLQNFGSILWILIFIFYRKKYGLTYGLYKLKKKFRWADTYLNFTELNATYIQARDGVPKDRFRMTGNASFDGFFQMAMHFTPSVSVRYLLLIDSPFVEAAIFGMTPLKKNEFIIKLNDFAISKGLKLYIKLHPLSFNSDYYFKNANIIYYKNHDINILILESAACVYMHLSSLMPLGILYKPFLFFNTYPAYNPYILSMDIKAFDFYNFEIAELVFSELDEKNKKLIIDRFLFSTDGQAIKRIENYLVQ